MYTNLQIYSTVSESQKRIKDINVDSKAYCSVSSKKKNQIKRVFYRKKKSIGHSKAIIAPTKKIFTIIWHLIANDKMYADEIGFGKWEIHKRIIVENEISSVNTSIEIIVEIIAIIEKKVLGE